MNGRKFRLIWVTKPIECGFCVWECMSIGEALEWVRRVKVCDPGCVCGSAPESRGKYVGELKVKACEKSQPLKKRARGDRGQRKKPRPRRKPRK